MPHDNINLRKSNFVIDNGYFYTMDEELDSLVVKTDDGTQAFSYPLDTTLTTPVVALAFDGINFWSLENIAGTKVTIRRWKIDNYICKIQNTFELTSNVTDTYDSNTFSIEHYHSTFSANATAGVSSSISIHNASKLNSTYVKKITLGPSSASGYEGLTETIDVSNSDISAIYLSGRITNSYMDGDPVNYYGSIWLFNNYYGTVSTTGALYRISGYVGTKIGLPRSGGEFKDIRASTFYSLPASTFIRDDSDPEYGNTYDAIAFVKTTNILFIDPLDLSDNFGSLSMDNVEDDQTTPIVVYAISMEGDNVYRLQLKATYLISGNLTTEEWTTYNYQLSTLTPFITSISLRANPAIVPASSATNASTITAVVKDQFNLPLEKQVVFTMSPTGIASFYGSTTPTSNPQTGEATVGFNSGNQAAEIVITATAQQG